MKAIGVDFAASRFNKQDSPEEGSKVDEAFA
jgi:hypothetical protein